MQIFSLHCHHFSTHLSTQDTSFVYLSLHRIWCITARIGDNSLNLAQAHLTLALAVSSTPFPTPRVTQIAKLGYTFQLYIGFNLNLDFSHWNWLDRTSLQAFVAMEINITLQLSRDTATSFMTPPETLCTTWMFSKILIWLLLTWHHMTFVLPAFSVCTVRHDNVSQQQDTDFLSLHQFEICVLNLLPWWLLFTKDE